MLMTVDGSIFVELIPNLTPELKIKSGFGVIAQRATLIGLNVLIGNEKFKVGEKVYVSEEATKHTWATKVFDLKLSDKLSTVSGVFLPESFILMYDKKMPINNVLNNIWEPVPNGLDYKVNEDKSSY